MTLTRGAVSTEGVFKISHTYDSLGVMARDPRDLAVLAEVLLSNKVTTPAEGQGLWNGLSVGIVKSNWGVQNVPESLGKGKWDLPDVVCFPCGGAR